MNDELLILIQARKGSSRLPGKIMKEAASATLLERMYERVNAAKIRKKIVIITTTDSSDDELAELCESCKFEYYRGHPTDLLERHYMAAKIFEYNHIAKIPSDCPLICPGVVERVADYYFENSDKFDYVSNLHPATYPDGNDVEIMKFAALETAYNEAKQDFEREHTTPYLWENPDRFRIGNVVWETGLDYSMTHRFTIDYEEDYEFISRVYSELYRADHIFTLEEIIKLLEEKPQLQEINSKFAGINWYRHHLDQLKTVSSKQTKSYPENANQT